MRKKLNRPLVVILFAACLILAGALPIIGQRSPVREVSLIILVDRNLLENAAAGKIKADIRKIVSAGSKIYEKEFGITFTIKEIRGWNLPTNKEVNADNAIFDAAHIANSEPVDIAIGVVREPLFKCRLAQKRETRKAGDCSEGEEKYFVAGYAYILGNAAVISLKENGDVFIHEVGHIFGADHTNEDSIMNDHRIGKEFDAKNREIILKNRNHIFEKMPLP